MSPLIFDNEEQMKTVLVEWLRKQGFTIISTKLYIKSFEIDVVAYAPLKISKSGIKKVNNHYVYAFETKIASTYKLMRDVIEQAITRLLVADYVFVVVPAQVETWKNEKAKEQIFPPFSIKKMASGVYSKNIGIIAINPEGNIEIIRYAKRSGLVVTELKKRVVEALRSEAGRALPL